jgi:hypothetical protein
MTARMVIPIEMCQAIKPTGDVPCPTSGIDQATANCVATSATMIQWSARETGLYLFADIAADRSCAPDRPCGEDVLARDLFRRKSAVRSFRPIHIAENLSREGADHSLAPIRSLSAIRMTRGP